MAGVEIAGAAATCGGVNTGSTTVFAEGKGITRILVDTADAAVITGPGSSTVFVEGSKVSLPGDAITSHGPTVHGAALTANPAKTVTAGP